MDDEYDNSSFCTLTIPEQLCLMCLYNKGILKLSLDRKQYTRALYLAVLCEMMIQNDMLLSTTTTTTTTTTSTSTSTAAVENNIVQMDSYFDYDNPSFENHNNNHNNRYKSSSSSSSRTSTGNSNSNSNSSAVRRSNSHNNNNNNNNNNYRNNNKSGVGVGVGVVLEEENDFYFRFDSHVELLDQFTTHSSSSSSSSQQHQQSYNNDDDDDDDDDHHHDNLNSDNNDYHDYHDDNDDEYELNDKNTKKNKSLRQQQQQQQINHHTRSKNKREEAGRRQKDNKDDNNKDDNNKDDDEGEMNPCLMFSGESEMTFFIRRFMTVASEQQSLHNYRLLSFVRNILWSNSNTMQNSMEQQVIYNIDSHIGIMLSKNNRTVEFKSSWLFGTCRFPIVNTRVKQQIKHYVLQMIECYGTKREKVIDRRGFALLACLNLIDTILIKEIIQKKQEIVSELSCDASTATSSSSPSFLMNNGRNNSGSGGGSGSGSSGGGGLLNSVSSMFGGGGSGSAITADERAKQEQLRKKARTIVLNGKVDHPDDIYYHFFQYLI